MLSYVFNSFNVNDVHLCHCIYYITNLKYTVSNVITQQHFFMTPMVKKKKTDNIIIILTNGNY